jgi:hypothetical protein
MFLPRFRHVFSALPPRQCHAANFHGHGMFHVHNDNIYGTNRPKSNVLVDKRG